MAQMTAYELGNSLVALFARRQLRETGRFLVFQQEGCVQVDTDASFGKMGVKINSVDGTPYGENVGEVVERLLAEEGVWGITATSSEVYSHLRTIGVFEGSSTVRTYRKGDRVYKAVFGGN